jgi:hypothetical protein
MNRATRDAIAEIMDKLTSLPLNADFFCHPEDFFPDYTDRIAKPMDLTRIQTKIDQDEYATAREWHDDVCLIYTNAIHYYSPETPLHVVANYLLKYFRKLTLTFRPIDPAAWFAALNSQYEKFVTLAGNSPVPQGLDPMLAKITTASLDRVPPKAKEIAETMDWLNRAVENEETAKDVVHLLSRLQPDLDFRNASEVVIDGDKLNTPALQALVMYVNAQIA